MAFTTDAHGARTLTNTNAVAPAAGKVGTCAQFVDASSQTLSVASDAGIEFLGVDCYWCAWVKFLHIGTEYEVPLCKRPGTHNGEWQLHVTPAGELQFETYGSGGVVDITSSVTPTVGVWYFIEWGVKDGGATGFICVNRGTEDTGAVAIDTAASSLFWGSDSGFEFFDGLVDQCAVYSFVPSGAYRDELYNGGAGKSHASLSSTTGLVSFWEFESDRVTLSATPLTIAENGGQSTVTATIDSSQGVDVTVDLSFADSTATEGVDFSASSTSIVIPIGSLTGAITVTALDDALTDPGETIVVNIANVTNGTENGTQQVTITISDDDGQSIVPFIASIPQGRPMQYQQNSTTAPITFEMRHSETGMLLAGLTPTVRLSKNGGEYAAPAGAVGEMTLGAYSIAPVATDFNTAGALRLIATAANCITTVKEMFVSAFSPTVGLPSVAPGLSGGLPLASGAGLLAIDATGHAYADARKWLGTTIATPDTAGHPKVTIKSGSGTGEITLSSGAVRAVDNSGANIASATNLATAQASLNTIQTSISSLATTTQLGNSAATLLTGITDLKATGSALLATTGAILDDTGVSGVVVAAGSKSGYALAANGLNLIPITDPGVGIANYNTWPTFLVGLFQAQISHATQKSTAAGTITVFGSDGTTANLTMGYTSAGGIDRKGAAT